MNPYKPHLTPKVKDVITRDSFQNFAARIGIGTDNVHSESQYGFNPITRNRLRLEWCYRGSWLAGIICDAPAQDMTREWVEIKSTDDPADLQELEEYQQSLQLKASLTKCLAWANLYGGATGLLLIDGADNSTPLRLETIGKDQFKGIYPMDRWMTLPHINDLVTDLGPDLGKPKYYDLLPGTGTGLKTQKIHYSRMIRCEGLELPFWQRMAENYWGQSVLERLWDRMVSFDSASMGAAQLTYKAHLRTLSIKGLREIIAGPEDALSALYEQIAMMRRFASQEGITLIDAEDTLETHQYAFSGLSDVIMQFGMQLSGASQIPLVRLFGQSPAGLSATGESDMRNYYDGIKMKQETGLRPNMWKLYQILYRSKFGREPPLGMQIKFRPLWQMSDEMKATITLGRTQAVVAAVESNIIDHATAMKELQALQDVTGAFSHIDDKDIKAAEALPAPTPEAMGLALPPKPEPAAGGKPQLRAVS